MIETESIGLRFLEGAYNQKPVQIISLSLSLCFRTKADLGFKLFVCVIF